MKWLLRLWLMTFVFIAAPSPTNAQDAFTPRINAIDWDPYGTYVAVGGGVMGCESDEPDASFLHIISHWTLEVLIELHGANCAIQTVDWSPDGTMIAATDGQGVFIWDAVTGEPIPHSIPSYAIINAQWSPDSAYLAYHDLRSTAIQIEQFKGENRGIGGIVENGGQTFAWSPDGRYIAASLGPKDGFIHITDLVAESETELYPPTIGQEVQIIQTPGLAFRLDWNTDGTKIAAAINDGSAQIWDASTGDLVVRIAPDEAVSDLAWHPGQDVLITVSHTGWVRRYDGTTGEELAFAQIEHPVTAFGWEHSGRRLAYGGEDQTVEILHTDDFTEILPSSPACEPSLSDMIEVPLLPDGLQNGKIAFDARKDGDAEIYVMNPDGTDIVQLTDNDIEDSKSSWSPDGTQLAYLHEYRLIILDANGNQIFQLPDVLSFAWSPDGRQIALQRSWNIAVFDLETLTLTPLTDDDRVFDSSPTWSPDGAYIAYVSSGDRPVPFALDGDPLLDIYIMAADGSGRCKIAIGDGGAFGLGSLNWYTNDAIIYGAGFSRPGVFSIRLSDGTITQLTDPDISSSSPEVSPDRRKIVYLHDHELAIMNLDGSDPVTITDTQSENLRYPSWQPVYADD